MEYKIKFEDRDAKVMGLKSEGIGWDSEDRMIETTYPDTWIHFGRFKDEFFGGMGEGQSCETWQDAILLSLYDLYQVNSNLHKGDTFIATYENQTQIYRCLTVDVVSDRVCGRCLNSIFEGEIETRGNETMHVACIPVD